MSLVLLNSVLSFSVGCSTLHIQVCDHRSLDQSICQSQLVLQDGYLKTSSPLQLFPRAAV